MTPAVANNAAEALAALEQKWRDDASGASGYNYTAYEEGRIAEKRRCADELATLRASLAKPQGEAVAFTVIGPDGKSSIGGWMDMRVHEAAQTWAVLREGHRYAYAYTYEQPAAPPEGGE